MQLLAGLLEPVWTYEIDFCDHFTNLTASLALPCGPRSIASATEPSAWGEGGA